MFADCVWWRICVPWWNICVAWWRICVPWWRIYVAWWRICVAWWRICVASEGFVYYSDGTNPNIVLRETEIDKRELRDSTELCHDLSCLTTSLVVRWWWHEGRRGGAEIFQCSLSWLWSQQDNYLSQTPGGPLMSRTVVNFPPLLTPTLEATHSWFICKYYDDNSK